jgi:hypothetical protein
MTILLPDEQLLLPSVPSPFVRQANLLTERYGVALSYRSHIWGEKTRIPG